jgi:hypothetical protein
VYPTHVIVCTDVDSGFQGLYVGGERVDQDYTIYACDIATATKGIVCTFSHVIVNMPEGRDEYPKLFDECMLWIASDNAA